MHLDILSNGRVLRQIDHQGRRYLVAPATGAYIIRLTNTSDRRQLAIVTVDGVNIVNNAEGSARGNGYVLRPGQTTEIPGWRRDNNEVAAFEFGAKSDSYTSQTGRGDQNNGAIGLAVYNERLIVGTASSGPVRRTKGTAWSFGDDFGGGIMRSFDGGHEGKAVSSTLGPQTRACATKGITRGSDLGTGYGSRTSFQTATTSFVAETDVPIQTIELIYATRERLIELGVPVEQAENMPSAFPADRAACPAPPGWNG